MKDKVSSIRQQFKNDLNQVKLAKDVEQLKVKYLGKKGVVQELLMELRLAASEDRPLLGKVVNELKEEISSLSEKALEGLTLAEQEEKIQNEKIDVTLPGRRLAMGKIHPIQKMFMDIVDILSGMGFSVQYGPDIDTDYYTFESLNYPEDHPARDMQDTFYINADRLLRSHTSNVQVRTMENYRPPIRIIAPGTVYRNETISARSHVFFHQVEGLYIDKDVTFADLLATMKEFWNKLFQSEVLIRFRPSFFPFVEPGVEVDLRCTSCNGEGCRLCKQTGWLEVCGAGMVHPEVLKCGGIDPEMYAGYAWGMGVERLALLRYGISDIRTFTENDIRFLEQF